MKRYSQPTVWLLAAAFLVAGGAIHAQQPSDASPSVDVSETHFRDAPEFRATFPGMGSRTDNWPEGAPIQEEGSVGYCQICADSECEADFFVGADYLFVRPHFSEAVAFAQGTLGASSFDVVGRDLDFGYDSSLRAFAGYRFGNGDGELRFTFWHLSGETSADAANPGAGQFIVDPFGNVVGTAIVLDPNSALFGTPIVGGEAIHTEARVDANICDLDFAVPWVAHNPNWTFLTSIGIRVADIDQFYESVIVDGAGDFFSGGDFSVDFIGVGPRVGLESRRYFGDNRRLSLFAKAHGALLVGDYDVRFSQTTTAPPFQASQTSTAARTIPVTETELGATCRIGDSFNLSTGWLFQAWYDMGTSGGKFGGFFSGADDANIMSFDGLFVRGEFGF
ncbi:MAG: Lpg1974 family pore-forming outer membrane protein [Planctomycetaceae bacterium]